MPHRRLLAFAASLSMVTVAALPVAAQDGQAAAGGRQQPQEKVQQGGFTRTVGAQQSDDLPLLNLDGYFVNHSSAAVSFYKAICMKSH